MQALAFKAAGQPYSLNTSLLHLAAAHIYWTAAKHGVQQSSGLPEENAMKYKPLRTALSSGFEDQNYLLEPTVFVRMHVHVGSRSESHMQVHTGPYAAC